MNNSVPFVPNSGGTARIVEERGMTAHRCKPKGRSGAGFTLIELILVLVITGLIISLITPAITSTTGLSLRTATKKIAAGLRYARSQAITTGSVYQVVFDIDGNEMIIERMAEEDPYGLQAGGSRWGEKEEGEGEGDEEHAGTRYEKKTCRLPKGVAIASVVADGEEINRGEALIEFYPNGSCSGGDVFLTNDKERVYRIALDFITGVVTIEEEER